MTRVSRAELQQRQQEQAARRHRERRLLGLLALAVVVVLVGGGLGLQQYRTGRRPTAAPVTTALAPVRVVEGQPLLLGEPAARTRVRLYEDFHCQHCAEFEETFGPTLTGARSDGRVALELYPMAFIDEGSTAAANALACAAEAGFGGPYYSGLFANQPLIWSDRQLTALADELLPAVPASFGPCVTGRAHGGWVTSINAAAAASGVTATPTLLVAGQPVDVATLTPDRLDQLVDQAART